MEANLSQLFRRLLLFMIIGASLFLSACYTTPPNPATPHDPLQHLNRDAVRFNDKLDKAVLKPVAKGYTAITPYVVRRSVGNFFSNLDEIPVVFNDFLQGDVEWGFSDIWRFIINTTVGIFGLFDPASHIGLMPHRNDFGLTLNRWHIYTPYLVLPVLGPNTIGSSLGIPIDYYVGLRTRIFSFRVRVALFILNGINRRAALLQLEKTANQLIIDPYTFQRSAYLQFRAHLLQINKNGPQFPSEDDAEDNDNSEG